MWLQNKTYLRGLGRVMSHETAKNAKKHEQNLQKYLYKPSKTGFTVYTQSK